jgi:hypothetical protein
MKTTPPIRELVKDPSWQKIRVQLLGQWSKNPVGCCQLLRHWLGPVAAASDVKLAIMANYLTGTAFRIGRIKHSCVTQLRTEVFVQIKLRKTSGKWSL